MAKPRIKKKIAPIVSVDAVASASPPPKAPPPTPSGDPSIWWYLIPVVVLAVAVFANTLDGQFVYDDTRQIVRNTLIQDGSQFWRAIFSDVWAFKGGNAAVSNYWRPSFVVWLIANFQAFGVEDARGWHLTNLLLHAAGAAMAFVVARRFDFSAPVACAVAVLFAVHPVHTESVAWVSGSPDLILAVALLGSLWFAASLAERSTPSRWVWALSLYAVALGAKEVAILFPVVVVAAVWAGPRAADTRDEKGIPLNRALRLAAPFAGLAVVYFFARLAILGSVSKSYTGGAGLVETILSAPEVFAFYLRQLVFPYWIGPSYPLRAVTASTIGLTNFVIPTVVSVAALAGVLWAARRSRRNRVAAALFLLLLAPAMNIGAFHPEQLVHDRYLYMPLFGFLLLAFSLGVEALETRVGGERAARIALVASAILGVPLFVATVSYNHAWMSDLALWERGVVSDPTSSFNFLQYASALDGANRVDEARAAIDRSIEIQATPAAYMGRGRIEVKQRQFDAAERDLRLVVGSARESDLDAYTLYQTYESLAICYEQQQQFDKAVSALGEGRTALPIYAAAMTEKIAVVYYQAGRKNEALAELEAYRAAARVEPLPESKAVIFRIGLLYAELQKNADAKAAFQEYLTLTESFGDSLTRALRPQAINAIRSLPG